MGLVKPSKAWRSPPCFENPFHSNSVHPPRNTEKSLNFKDLRASHGLDKTYTNRGISYTLPDHGRNDSMSFRNLTFDNEGTSEERGDDDLF